MKIGIYGGTFDPIHFGHLNLAIQIKEKLELDEIWLVPAQINPLKTEATAASASDRLQMLELAIENLPYVKLCRIELERAGPSYTVDTIQLLQETFPRHEFSLIIGLDSLARFEEWKNAEEIVRRVPLVVGKRIEKDQKTPSFSTNYLIQKAVEKGIVETSVMEISATDIRERINRGLYIEHLVPSKVVDYIYDNHLYFKD